MSDADYIAFLEFLVDNGLRVICRDLGPDAESAGESGRFHAYIDNVHIVDFHPGCREVYGACEYGGTPREARVRLARRMGGHFVLIDPEKKKQRFVFAPRPGEQPDPAIGEDLENLNEWLRKGGNS
jgi:hypothetical protein